MVLSETVQVKAFNTLPVLMTDLNLRIFKFFLALACNREHTAWQDYLVFDVMDKLSFSMGGKHQVRSSAPSN